MGSNPRRRLIDADPLRVWIDQFVAEIGVDTAGRTPLSVVQDVVGAGLESLGLNPEKARLDLDGASSVTPDPDGLGSIGTGSPPPGGWANPWLPGLVHERVVSGSARKARGAWYTPRPVVDGLVALVYRCVEAPPFAVDPTCGGGAFLLALLDHWVADGVEPQDAIGRVAGTDIDPGAAAVCRWALQLWAGSHGVEINGDDLDVSVADALVNDAPARWPKQRLTIGNPPFASPLKKGAMPDQATEYRRRHNGELGQYADLAALHLHRAVDTAAPDSVVALIVPQSVVSSRDVEDLRDRLATTCTTAGMWAAREAVFDAGIRTCAAVVVVGQAQHPSVLLAAGPDVRIVGESTPDRWSSYAARCLGAPTLPESVVEARVTLSELCSATAGFRDEFYGLVEACTEWSGPGEPSNRLVTVGSIDPLRTGWGETPIRFGGRTWSAPTIESTKLNDKVKRWCDRQAKPKVVVATQSRLLEPVVDLNGCLVPSTPLLAVHASTDDLALIAAVLLSPPVVAVAWERWFGSALAVDALKLAARQLGQLPLPSNRRKWQQAAGLIDAQVSVGRWLDAEVANAVSVEVAALMNEAYGAENHVLQWWLDRAGR